jgi:hypothetical protein
VIVKPVIATVAVGVVGDALVGAELLPPLHDANAQIAASTLKRTRREIDDETFGVLSKVLSTPLWTG